MGGNKIQQRKQPQYAHAHKHIHAETQQTHKTIQNISCVRNKSHRISANNSLCLNYPPWNFGYGICQYAFVFTKRVFYNCFLLHFTDVSGVLLWCRCVKQWAWVYACDCECWYMYMCVMWVVNCKYRCHSHPQLRHINNYKVTWLITQIEAPHPTPSRSHAYTDVAS